MKKIIIADDEESILEIVEIVLSEKGHDVICVSKPSEVYERVIKEKPDILLLDLWMPGVSGEEIATKLKSNNASKNIPIIVFSASKETEEVAKKVNADGFLLKPFDIDNLVNLIESY